MRRVLLPVYSDRKQNLEVTQNDKEFDITLYYPNVEGNASHIVLDQSSVRASDGIRLHYDYDRDGWVVEQASVFEWEADDPVMDPDWQEVAFIKSWQRERKS